MIILVLTIPLFGMFKQVFDWDRWQDGFDQYWKGDANEAVRETFRGLRRHTSPSPSGCKKGRSRQR